MPTSSSDNLADMLNQMAEAEADLVNEFRDHPEEPAQIESQPELEAKPEQEAEEATSLDQPIEALPKKEPSIYETAVAMATNQDVPDNKTTALDTEPELEPNLEPVLEIAPESEHEVENEQTNLQVETDLAPASDQLDVSTAELVEHQDNAEDSFVANPEEESALDMAIDLGVDAVPVTQDAAGQSASRSRTKKVKSKPKKSADLKATAAPVLMTFGLVMLVPAVWAVLILMGIEAPMHERESVDKMALFMLVCWPIGLALFAGGIFFMVQSMKQKKQAQ